jgi:hypothetical protein
MDDPAIYEAFYLLRSMKLDEAESLLKSKVEQVPNNMWFFIHLAEVSTSNTSLFSFS